MMNAQVGSLNNVGASIFNFNLPKSIIALLVLVFSTVIGAAVFATETETSKNHAEKHENAKLSSKPTVIILLGAPGSGKGTQAVKLSKALKLTHISTGDILRENIKNETALGKKIKTYLDSGKLVPDALISEIVFERVEKPDVVRGYILDGYPRTTEQAKALRNHLNDKANVIVINLEAPDEKLIVRILKRANEKAEKRSDDTPEVAKNRLKIYHEHTKPVIHYYKEKGELSNINADKGPEDVFKEIMQVINQKRKELNLQI